MFNYRIDYQVKGSKRWYAYELIEKYNSADVSKITTRLKSQIKDIKHIRVMKSICNGLFWKKDHQLSKKV